MLKSHLQNILLHPSRYRRLYASMVASSAGQLFPSLTIARQQERQEALTKLHSIKATVDASNKKSCFGEGELVDLIAKFIGSGDMQLADDLLLKVALQIPGFDATLTLCNYYVAEMLALHGGSPYHLERAFTLLCTLQAQAEEQPLRRPNAFLLELVLQEIVTQADDLLMDRFMRLIEGGDDGKMVWPLSEALLRRVISHVYLRMLRWDGVARTLRLAQRHDLIVPSALWQEIFEVALQSNCRRTDTLAKAVLQEDSLYDFAQLRGIIEGLQNDGVTLTANAIVALERCIDKTVVPSTFIAFLNTLHPTQP